MPVATPFPIPVELQNSKVVAIAYFGYDGELLNANLGFLHAIEASVAEGSRIKSHVFLQPRFEELITRIPDANGVIYKGLLTLGSISGVSRCLHGQISLRDGIFHLVAEYDLDDMDALQQSVLELNAALTESSRQVGRANRELEQRVAERTRELEQSEFQFRTLIEAAPDAMVIADEHGKIIMINKSTETLFGYERNELRGRSIEALLPDRFHEGHIPLRTASTLALKSGNMSPNRDVFGMTKDGREFPVNINLSTIKTANGLMAISSIRDITERKLSEKRLQMMATVFSNSSEAIIISDSDNRILTTNTAFTTLTGYTQEEVIGQNPKLLSAGTTPPETYKEMWESISQKGYWQGEIWDRRKSGEPYPKWISIAAVCDNLGQVSNYIGSFTDISDRKASEEKIRHLAYHDSLTNLPNRFSLNEKLQQAITFAKRSNGQLALMLIDLDRFKMINDTLGHQAGDDLLIQVALRLGSSVRESDVVARLGGDEFVIVQMGISSPSEAAHLAEKIVSIVSEPYTIEGQIHRTSPSIGICLYPSDASTSIDLLKNADVAMYEAKSKGRAGYRFFTASMTSATEARMGIEADLRDALSAGQLSLHYQPQLSLRTGTLVGVEALIRWRHPIRGMISPVEFIPIAEETGLINPIGEWVLREACRQLKIWHGNGLTHLRMSINLSAHQFMSPDLPDLIQTIIYDTGLLGNSIDLEVTESMSMASPDQAIAMMRTLTEGGMSISIDDFGTGYSSLAYLKLFPIQTLKIDRSFVKDIETDSNDKDICDVTVLLAHKLGFEVVAEGVETEEQLKFLLSIGCEKIQGYLISKPLEANEAESFIKNFTPVSRLGSVDLWEAN